MTCRSFAKGIAAGKDSPTPLLLGYDRRMSVKTRSLRTSILFFVALGLTLPALVATPLLYDRYRREVETRTRMELEQYTNILALGAREPLWNLSPDAIRPLIEAVRNNPDVVSVTIVDRTVGPLIEVSSPTNDLDVKTGEQKIVYKGRELGSVRVSVTGQSVRTQQFHQMVALSLIIALQLAVAAVLIFALLRRRLVAPLESLGASADALAQGELEQEIPFKDGDEIGRLGSRLESTRKRLLGLFADLAAKNSALANELEERQRSEAAQRESEARLQTVFTLANTPLSVSRKADGLFLMINPAWRATFGHEEEAVIGRSAEEIGLWVDSAERARCMTHLEAEGMLKAEEIRLRHRDRRELLIEATARPFRAGGEELLVWNLRDITAARQAEAALRESEQRFAALFHHAPVALCILDLDNECRILDVNTQFECNFGHLHDRCVGRPLSDLQLWENADDARQFVTLASIEYPQDKMTVWIRHHDKQRSCHEVSGRQILLHERRCFIWSAIDVTPIIQAKEMVEDVNRNLEDKVATRTRDLAAAIREQTALLDRLRNTQNQLVQSEKLAALGALVAGISHELNTPIGNCLMVASTIDDQRRDLERSMANGLRKSAFVEFLEGLHAGNEALLRNLHRAADLVSSFKQVAVDQTSSQRRVFDLREVVREIEVTLGPSLRKSRCSFHNNLPTGIEMDSFPGPLGQIITNLTTNAIKHGFEGRNQGEIHVNLVNSNTDQVCFVFSDDGRGIPPENLPRIFDPFFTTKLGQGGSGLGLNIVYNITSIILGGTIHVDSAPGNGCHFRLTLPRKAPEHEIDGLSEPLDIAAPPAKA